MRRNLCIAEATCILPGTQCLNLNDQGLTKLKTIPSNRFLRDFPFLPNIYPTLTLNIIKYY